MHNLSALESLPQGMDIHHLMLQEVPGTLAEPSDQAAEALEVLQIV